jgi:hypothetical protein
MLGRPVNMLIPKVVGVRLTGAQPEGSTATDLMLTIAERLRHHGVAGAFVEFYGPGVAEVPLANRATIGDMSLEYGATCAIFPIDAGAHGLGASPETAGQSLASGARPTCAGVQHDRCGHSVRGGVDASGHLVHASNVRRQRTDPPGRHLLACGVPGRGVDRLHA